MKLIEFFSPEQQKKYRAMKIAVPHKKYEPLEYRDLVRNPPKPPEWLVDGLFPRSTINILGGDGGVGKSWVVLHLALCVASGKKFLGKFEVKQGKVLIIDEENALALISERLRKLRVGMGLREESLPLQIMENQGIRLDNPESLQGLKEQLKTERCDLVIIDSLIRIHAADENSSREMDGVFRRVKELVKEFDTTIVMTHHSRKPWQFSTQSQLRGSSDIRNFADCVLMMADRKGVTTLTHDKSRWAAPLENLTVSIEDTDDGKGIVVRASEQNPTKKSVEVDTAEEKAEKKAKEVIQEYKKTGNKTSRKELKTAFISAGIGVNAMDKALTNLVKEKGVIVEGGNGKPKYFSM